MAKDKETMNLSLSDAEKRYLALMAGLNGVSMTQYMRGLLERDRERNGDVYEAAKKLADKVK